MNVASLELSKTLFELSGWEDTGYCFGETKRGWKLELTIVFDNYGGGKQYGCVAAYPLNYLLDKLKEFSPTLFYMNEWCIYPAQEKCSENWHIFSSILEAGQVCKCGKKITTAKLGELKDYEQPK